MTVETCIDKQDLLFDINPTDADNGHNINMEVNGLPKGSKLGITNNNTTHPRGRFVWIMSPGSGGDYTFFVTYTDDGCPIASKQTQAYTIHVVEDCDIASDTTAEIPREIPDDDTASFPKAFTPNGDGRNDVLLVRATNDAQELHFRIYNRWGQLVFETNDVNTGWDGKYKGKDAPVDAYGYVLSVIFKGGKTFQKQGNITLLR